MGWGPNEIPYPGLVRDAAGVQRWQRNSGHAEVSGPKKKRVEKPVNLTSLSEFYVIFEQYPENHDFRFVEG